MFTYATIWVSLKLILFEGPICQISCAHTVIPAEKHAIPTFPCNKDVQWTLHIRPCPQGCDSRATVEENGQHFVCNPKVHITWFKRNQLLSLSTSCVHSVPGVSCPLWAASIYPWDWCYLSHFTHEETEAQRGISNLSPMWTMPMTALAFLIELCPEWENSSVADCGIMDCGPQQWLKVC